MKIGKTPVLGLATLAALLSVGSANAPAGSGRGSTLHLTAIVTKAKLSGPASSPSTSTDINLSLLSGKSPAGKVGAHCSAPGDLFQCRGRTQVKALGPKFNFLSLVWTCSTTSPSCASVGIGTIDRAGKLLGNVRFKTPPLTKTLGGKPHKVPHQFPVVIRLRSK